MTNIDRARAKAIEVLRSCAHQPRGFHASGLKGGYEALWARDSMICSLGASLVGEEFKEAMKNSLETLARHQTKLGLIPTCIGDYNEERQSYITFNAIDAPQWYIIGHYVYTEAYADTRLIKKYRRSILKALSWLKHQDPNNDNLIVQQPCTDWMDAFPHKYGRVMHTQALQFALLKIMGENKLANSIKDIVNSETQKYLALYDEERGYYLPWVWKDHGGDREQEEWFDSAANLFAILTGLATPAIAKKILAFIDKEKINRPYQCKNIWPPIEPGSPAWKPYFNRCDARTPFHYINGGIWLWIGGLYVAALVKAQQFKKASRELKILAEGCLQEVRLNDELYGFCEWLDGKTGEPKSNPNQAWNAGMYLYAYECVRRKKVIYFEK
ncbi:MAG: amylo-alpha-1,6-glucosidase [bacterium]|nr:amylo-alpha-1,6-glucosidase [bacterium]